MDLASLQQAVVFLIALIIGIDVHECCHAWAADQLGDSTARYLGRLSLNPLVHLDPLGTVMMLIMALSHVGIGWGKPVPVTPYRLRHGRIGMGLVSFAGPLSNLTLAILVGIALRLPLPLPSALAYVLFVIVLVNISLMLFNLIPLPPLDGFGVLLGVLDAIRAPWAYNLSRTLIQYEPQLPGVLFLLLALSWISPINPIWMILGPLYSLLSWLILGLR
jgi:Zn-dependent protease